MTTIRQAVPSDLPAMAELAAGHQADPARHCLYLSVDADAIAEEVAELDDWASFTAVAEVDGSVVGWLFGEPDPDMGRVWWWGPFAPLDSWAEVADQLYHFARDLLGDTYAEEEAAADARSDLIAAWAARHGFAADPGSVLLRREPTPATVDPRVRPMTPADHDVVKALHDIAFPGTHTPPAMLVASEHPRLVIEEAGRVVGYVAYEMQPDGSGYIDYLAVDEQLRGRGLGRGLVSTATADLVDRGVTYAHLTVREANASARALYSSLAYDEERIAIPYRRGFTLP